MKTTKKLTTLLLAIIFVFSLNGAANAHPTHLAVGGEDIQELNKEIGQKKEEIKKIEENQEQLEKEIEEKKNEQRNLENQISIIESEIDLTVAEIEKTAAEIEKMETEIEATKVQIDEKNHEIESQKKVLVEYIRTIQQYDAKTPLELILANSSFSEFLDQAKYLETLENSSQETLDEVQELKEELLWQQKVLEAKNEKLKKLKSELDLEKESLDKEKSSKDNLLEVTKDQEEEFEKLLAESKRQQEQANAEIQNLEAQIAKQIREQSTTTERPEGWTEYSGNGQLQWPLNCGGKRISAYFKDPSYFNYFGVNHFAIDMPCPQGSTIYAPADGYVAKYRNAGYGYSYLMLHHGNGLSTVYGHIPTSLVAEGSYVKAGDPIAQVGGTPGTPGAGWMTTGPHLHFETRINGSPVDPLQFF